MVKIIIQGTQFGVTYSASNQYGLGYQEMKVKRLEFYDKNEKALEEMKNFFLNVKTQNVIKSKKIEIDILRAFLNDWNNNKINLLLYIRYAPKPLYLRIKTCIFYLLVVFFHKISLNIGETLIKIQNRMIYLEK
jgi:hypothetical protein